MLVTAALTLLTSAPGPAVSLPTGPTGGAGPSDDLTAPPGLVFIKGGRTKIGVDPKDILPVIQACKIKKLVGETPEHDVRVDDFFLMVTEVTNEQYERFVNTTGAKPPRSWGQKAIEQATIAFAHEEAERRRKLQEEGVTEIDKRTFDAADWWDKNWRNSEWAVPTDRKANPVEYVDFQDASAYARWAGLRLMTEFEYQRAGRGDTDSVFPWGDEFDKTKAATLERGVADSFPVGSFGATKQGVYDLVGNVWEWTSSPFEKYPGYKIFKIKIGEGRQQIEEEYVVDWDANQRVVVGGCYKTPWYAGRLTTRRATDRIQATDAMGFRCAASTAPGVDVASAVIRDLPLGVVPEGVLYDASRAVALDRWTTEPGTAGVEGYSVITGYHYFMFIPVEEAPASGLKRLVEVSHEDGPVHLGLLATTKPLLEPALEPGAYLVAWRGEGKAKELKPAEDEEGEEGEGEGEATDVVVEEAEDEIWDETVDSLIFYDTNGVAVLSVPARDLKYERLKKGEAFPRRVMPTEKEREAGQEPYQEIRFTVPVPGKQSSRGFMFDLRVQVDDGTVDDGWRKP